MWSNVYALQTKIMIQRPPRSDTEPLDCVITDPSGSGAFGCRCVGQAVLFNQLISRSHLQFTGVILLAVGVWGKVSLESYFSLASEESTNAPYVLIGTGAAIIIFGLFGCFATCRGSPWMLKLVSAAAALWRPLAVPFGSYSVCVFPTVCHVFDLDVPG